MDLHLPRQPRLLTPMGRRHIGRALSRKRGLRAGIVQFCYVAVAFVLGRVVPAIPIGFDSPGPETAQLLIAIAASVITLIGIVYSLLFVVVQFASSSFTPRLNLFRDSRIIWHAFGYFTGVFVFAVTAAFVIGNDARVTGLVPITIVLLLLGLLSTLRNLQDTAFRSIQLAPTLAQVARRGRRMLDDFYPDDFSAASPADKPRIEAMHEVRWTEMLAVVQLIDVARVLHAAVEANSRVELHVATGQTVFEHSLVALIDGPPDSHLTTEILKSITTGPERTFEQDPTLALRVLADIALRALSSAINDPTTAVQALDGAESLLRHLIGRDLDVGLIEDSTGTVRVVFVVPSWDDYVGVALDELIGLSPTPSLQVRLRLARLLDNLIAIAPLPRRPALESRRRKLELTTLAA